MLQDGQPRGRERLDAPVHVGVDYLYAEAENLWQAGTQSCRLTGELD
jgi:hypothetical protein